MLQRVVRLFNNIDCYYSNGYLGTFLRMQSTCTCVAVLFVCIRAPNPTGRIRVTRHIRPVKLRMSQYGPALSFNKSMDDHDHSCVWSQLTNIFPNLEVLMFAY